MHSGQLIDITNFKTSDVNIDDIAHHLSRIQRFNGALPMGVSYTVGEHSINLAKYVYSITGDLYLTRAALLHDASEAYMSDIVSPVKKALPEYCKLEKHIQS